VKRAEKRFWYDQNNTEQWPNVDIIKRIFEYVTSESTTGTPQAPDNNNNMNNNNNKNYRNKRPQMPQISVHTQIWKDQWKML